MSDPVSVGVPAGFRQLFRTSPVLDLIGPLYCRGEGEGLILGMQVATKHCNARGTLHGGILSMLADVALGYAMALSTDPSTSLTTATLTIDFAGSASVGDWLETRSDIQKIGGRLAFANCYINARGARIARASGVFAVAGAQPVSSPDSG